MPERGAKREFVMARGFDKFVQERLKKSEFRSKCEAKRKIIKQKKKTVQRVAKQLLASEWKALTDSSKQNYCDQARAFMGQKKVRGPDGRFVGVQADENLGDMVTPTKIGCSRGVIVQGSNGQGVGQSGCRSKYSRQSETNVPASC